MNNKTVKVLTYDQHIQVLKLIEFFTDHFTGPFPGPWTSFQAEYDNISL